MATFNHERQARNFIKSQVSRGPKKAPQNRHGLQPIRSIGTERDYTTVAKAITKWMDENKYGTLDRMTRKQALVYLNARAKVVCQTTLDRDRTIMDRLPRTGKKPLPRIKADRATGKLAKTSRAYEHRQLIIIEGRQREQNAISTALAWRCGVRAHELLTIKRLDRLTKRERARLERNQKWDPRRLAGRDGVLYIVRGKGGMMRIIVVPHDLAARLETQHIPEGIKTPDRKIPYRQYYDIRGGKNWSASFERASIRAFGYSLGGHGCRHTFAQDRLSEYRNAGFSNTDSRELTAQDLAHFRERITLAYLR